MAYYHLSVRVFTRAVMLLGITFSFLTGCSLASSDQEQADYVMAANNTALLVSDDRLVLDFGVQSDRIDAFTGSVDLANIDVMDLRGRPVTFEQLLTRLAVSGEFTRETPMNASEDQIQVNGTIPDGSGPQRFCVECICNCCECICFRVPCD